MANWLTLKTAIVSVIKTNGTQAITGNALQSVLNNIVSSVGENATFAGIATPSTNPGTPDGPVFYLATVAGVYVNFNEIEVSKGEAVILQWNNGAWSKKNSGLATQTQVGYYGEIESQYIADSVEALTLIPNVNWDSTKQYKLKVQSDKPLGASVFVGGTDAAGIGHTSYSSESLFAGIEVTISPTTSVNNGRVYIDFKDPLTPNGILVRATLTEINTIEYHDREDIDRILKNEINVKWYVGGYNTTDINFTGIHSVRFKPIVSRRRFDGITTEEVDIYDICKNAIEQSAYSYEFNIYNESREIEFKPSSLDNTGFFILWDSYLNKFNFVANKYEVSSRYTVLLYVASDYSGLYFKGKASEQWSAGYQNTITLYQRAFIEPWYGDEKSFYAGKDAKSLVISRGFSLYYNGLRYIVDSHSESEGTKEIVLYPDESNVRTLYYLDIDKLLRGYTGDSPEFANERWSNLTNCIIKTYKPYSHSRYLLLCGFYEQRLINVGEFGYLSDDYKINGYKKYKIEGETISEAVDDIVDAPTIINGFEVVMGHTYEIYVKSESLLNTDENATVVIGLSYNGPISAPTAKHIKEGIFVSFTAIANAPYDAGRVYLDIRESNGGVAGIKIKVSITDLTAYESIVSKDKQPGLIDGIIYDVSYSTKNEYTLDEILSNANNIIPFRHHIGGCVIKFIEKNTHLYVTYINRNTNWSVDVNDWDNIGSVDISFNSDVEEKIIQSKAASRKPNWAGYNTSPLVLLHFSDIHSDKARYDRISYIKNKYSAYIDDAIHTGDIVKMYYNDDFSFWSDNTILNCIGNHDTCVDNTTVEGWRGRTALETYDRFFAPFIDNWGVVKPYYAATNGACYYYKDYAETSIRLIVIDAMHYDDAQNEWLQSVINNSVDKHLIIASHFIPAETTQNSESLFDTIQPSNPWETDWTGCGLLDERVPIMVQSFINKGGDFICYLAGHVHDNIFRNLNDYPQQYVICADTARCEDSSCNSHISGTATQDNFNLLSFDVDKKWLSLVKLTTKFDRHLREFTSMLWNWSERKIIYQK